MDGVEPITLPGGFERGGQWQRTVWLRPLTGRDESLLAEPPLTGGQAGAVTALLARTVFVTPDGEAAGPDRARALTVGDREAALLHVRRMTLGDRMSCVLSCPLCDAKLDLDIRASELLLPPYSHSGHRHRTTVEDGGQAWDVHFRLPTGADQECVAALALRDPDAAATAMLERCIDRVTDASGARCDGWPARVRERVPSVMATLDPQAEVDLTAVCPLCNASFVAPFDAAQFMWRELALTESDLFRQVHLLALHYHWGESEILGMPRRRRRRYLGLLAETMAGDHGP
jgi:hypothetical protein